MYVQFPLGLAVVQVVSQSHAHQELFTMYYGTTKRLFLNRHDRSLGSFPATEPVSAPRPRWIAAQGQTKEMTLAPTTVLSTCLVLDHTRTLSEPLPRMLRSVSHCCYESAKQHTT